MYNYKFDVIHSLQKVFCATQTFMNKRKQIYILLYTKCVKNNLNRLLDCNSEKHIIVIIQKIIYFWFNFHCLYKKNHFRSSANFQVIIQTDKIYFRKHFNWISYRCQSITILIKDSTSLMYKWIFLYLSELSNHTVLAFGLKESWNLSTWISGC